MKPTKPKAVRLGGGSIPHTSVPKNTTPVPFIPAHPDNTAHVLNPSGRLLSKLGSIIIHMEEASSLAYEDPYDMHAARALLEDPEVVEWMAGMRKLAMLPVKRRE